MGSRCACVSKGMGGSGPIAPTLPPTGSGSEPAPPTGSGSEPELPTGSGSGSGSQIHYRLFSVLFVFLVLVKVWFCNLPHA